jgi:tRNA modification GTPase
MHPPPNTTIAAIATPQGQGGIGIIRISGPEVPRIAFLLLGKQPLPRHAHYATFYDADGRTLDQGILLYFPKPHSFTGEAVLELQVHGSPVVLDLLLKHLLTFGLALAKPGEFSERAFLHGKIDLVQAEAIADLISASSEHAAHSAMRSLQGAFSKRIYSLVAALIDLRVYIEAGLDFPEEDIDLLADSHTLDALEKIETAWEEIQGTAKQGALLREGMQVVIAGEPNVGKSSLLNQLSGQETAIVTDIPGTTRDILRTHIHIDGLPLHIIDTAGLRTTEDVVEREGIRRAEQAFAQADHIIWMLDSSCTTLPDLSHSAFFKDIPDLHTLTLIHNKIDLRHQSPRLEQHPAGYWIVHLSAKTGAGVDLLRTHLTSILGFLPATENIFIARRRHLDALDRAHTHLIQAKQQLYVSKAVECIAEELRLAQSALSEITGDFLPDDLLGEIFSRFCIGK